tara:strand:+ start:205 stop:1941 length:1737 start_codon:yes stop_codon:yes gene_type:complete
MKQPTNNIFLKLFNSMFGFIKSIAKELNPWGNIKILHTNIKGDILSGIMVAIIALPLALAFGEISRLGPEAGIWSAIVGGIVGGLFGGCLVGVSGPTAPMASQIAMFMGVFVIGTTNEPDLVAAFSIIFLSGLILVFISILKISRFIHYIPYSVISGFMCGIGAIVILTQINSFVGLESEKNTYDIFKNFRYTIQNVNVYALYVAIPCLLILFSWDFLQKRFKSLLNIPSPLAALIIGTSIAYFMNLNIPYIGDKMNIAEQSKIFTFYFPDLSRIGEFIIPAFLLAGLAVIDSLLSCKVADNMTGLRHSSDRETFGQGMANMSAGLLGGISTATATTQTVGNIEFGAKTPLSTIVKGLTLLGVLLGLGYLLAVIPNACLAAILFKLGIDILDYRILPVLRKIPISDLFIFIVVLFITVYQNLMVAVSVGVIIAILKSLNELISKSNYKYKIISILDLDFVSNEKQKKALDALSVKVLQLNGPLFFGTTEQLISIYNNASNHKILIIDMSRLTMIDLTGIYLLEDIIKSQKLNKIEVFVINAKQNIRKVVEKVNFIENIGKEYYKDSTKSVVSAILKNK